MSEEKNPMAPGLTDEERLRILENTQAEFLKSLKGISEELRRSEPGSAGEGESGIRKVMTGIGADLWGTTAEPATPVVKEQKDAPVPPEAKMTDIWKTADETIEWTEALGTEMPADGLTDIKRWKCWHELAPKVLAGDTDAYHRVLETLRPLDELSEYMQKCVLRVNSPERVSCTFECKGDLLTGKTAEYPEGLAVRIVRDLLATLPIGEVHVKACLGDRRLLEATVRREDLSGRNPLFLEPVGLIRECGGFLDNGEVTRI